MPGDSANVEESGRALQPVFDVRVSIVEGISICVCVCVCVCVVVCVTVCVCGNLSSEHLRIWRFILLQSDLQPIRPKLKQTKTIIINDFFTPNSSHI